MNIISLNLITIICLSVEILKYETNLGAKKTANISGEQHNGLNDKKNPAQEVYGKSLYDDSAYVDNEENQAFENSASDDTDEYPESRPRKRVRIRIPIVRSRVPKKHKLTVVRRRPLTPSTRNEQINRGTTQIPKRIVTRVRPLGLAHSRHSTTDINDLENITSETARHKITITRRRKLEPTISTVTPKRVRITRKKLIAVRPIEPTPTLAIITTGFFTAPSDYSDEYEDEENTEENIEEENHPTTTPSLEETPNVIESKPEEELNEFKSPILEVTSVYEVVDPMPVIITDNFFFPPSDDEEEENYEDNYTETTTSDDLTTDISTLLNEQNNTVQDDTRLENVDNTTVMSDVNEENLTNPVTEFGTLNEDVISNTDTDIDISVNTATLLPSVTIKESTNIFNEEDVNTLTILDSTNETSYEIMEITTSSPEEETTPIEEEETTLLQEEETTSLQEKETTPVQEEETTIVEEKETTPAKDEEIISLHDKEKLSIKTNDVITEITLSDMPDIFISADKTNTTIISEEFIEQSTTVSDVIEQPVTTISETIETNIERNSVPLSIDNTIKDFDSTKNISTSINDLADTNQILNSKDEQKDNEILTVKPIQSYNGLEIPSILITVNTSKTAVDNLSSSKTPDSDTFLTPISSISSNFDNSYIPSVIPLNTEYITSNTPEIRIKTTNVLTLNLTKTIPSPTPEDIEAGLVDDLYLSLSRPDFPEIVKSKSESIDIESKSMSHYVPLEPSTSIYYTETIVTSTRLRTYTYIVTKLNGLETQVTSSTTIRPRVTTLTLTVPITVTVTPTMESSVNTYSSICNAVSVFGE
ncbi:63 kDa sperm flagellar membrane protein [Vespula squamosa]|uniref:63 kDa sperm flagellar membrane protein n=1 Tax=Vespula squamosa TaxID=30214 RepID=A0ABD2AFU4_VESSQ